MDIGWYTWNVGLLGRSFHRTPLVHDRVHETFTEDSELASGRKKHWRTNSHRPRSRYRCTFRHQWQQAAFGIGAVRETFRKQAWSFGRKTFTGTIRTGTVGKSVRGSQSGSLPLGKPRSSVMILTLPSTGWMYRIAAEGKMGAALAGRILTNWIYLHFRTWKGQPPGKYRPLYRTYKPSWKR